MAHSGARLDEQQLQVFDVQLVDVLAQLEALLRHSHNIQRSLLQLRSVAHPPSGKIAGTILTEAQRSSYAMRTECAMLAQVIDDLATGLDKMNGTTPADRRSGRDRRAATVEAPADVAVE